MARPAETWRNTPPDRAARRDDERILRILHLLDVARAGPDFVGHEYDLTRGQIAGMRNRTTGAAAIARHPCECKRPENMDGGMPAKWWA